MTQKTYSIFGAGAAGLYTAWRLLDGKCKQDKFASKQLKKGDVLELYDWARYDFSKRHPGSRAAGASSSEPRLVTASPRSKRSRSHDSAASSPASRCQSAFGSGR